MIIVEGPDGSGKTTLIGRLLSQFEGLMLQDRVVDKNTNAMLDLKQWVENDLHASRRDMTRGKLYDRHRLISEPIYGPIMGREPQPGFIDRWWLGEMNRRLFRQGPLIIYCLPPIDEVWGNIQGDPDNLAVATVTDQLYQAYVARYCLEVQFRGSQSIIYDYTQSNHPQLEQALTAYAAGIHRRLP